MGAHLVVNEVTVNVAPVVVHMFSVHEHAHKEIARICTC